MQIGDRLRILMKKRGVTQSELADAMGKAQTVISRYINNNTMMGADVLKEIADYFSISADYFLSDEFEGVPPEGTPRKVSTDAKELTAEVRKEIRELDEILQSRLESLEQDKRMLMDYNTRLVENEKVLMSRIEALEEELKKFRGRLTNPAEETDPDLVLEQWDKIKKKGK